MLLNLSSLTRQVSKINLKLTPNPTNSNTKDTLPSLNQVNHLIG